MPHSRLELYALIVAKSVNIENHTFLNVLFGFKKILIEQQGLAWTKQLLTTTWLRHVLWEQPMVLAFALHHIVTLASSGPWVLGLNTLTHHTWAVSLPSTAWHSLFFTFHHSFCHSFHSSFLHHVLGSFIWPLARGFLTHVSFKPSKGHV